MSYEPTIWKKGDKVTSTKLNKIENGIQGNDEEVTSIKRDFNKLTTATAEDVGKALKAKTVTDGKVTEWEFGETGVAVDPTLTIEGKAADAKAAGDRLNAVENTTIGYDYDDENIMTYNSIDISTIKSSRIRYTTCAPNTTKSYRVRKVIVYGTSDKNVTLSLWKYEPGVISGKYTFTKIKDLTAGVFSDGKCEFVLNDYLIKQNEILFASTDGAYVCYGDYIDAQYSYYSQTQDISNFVTGDKIAEKNFMGAPYCGAYSVEYVLESDVRPITEKTTELLADVSADVEQIKNGTFYDDALSIESQNAVKNSVVYENVVITNTEVVNDAQTVYLAGNLHNVVTMGYFYAMSLDVPTYGTYTVEKVVIQAITGASIKLGLWQRSDSTGKYTLIQELGAYLSVNDRVVAEFSTPVTVNSDLEQIIMAASNDKNIAYRASTNMRSPYNKVRKEQSVTIYGNDDAGLYDAVLNGESLKRLRFAKYKGWNDSSPNSNLVGAYEITYNPTIPETITSNKTAKTAIDEFISGVARFSSLYGKVYYAAGDSITDGSIADADGVKRTYADLISARNGMVLYKDAISGSTMAATSVNSFAKDRYLNCPSNADFITLWFGANDHHSTIGDLNSDDETTFCGAYNKVLTYYISNMPTAKIGIVVTPTASNDLKTAIRNIAKKYGIKVFDFDNDPNIPFWNCTYGYYVNDVSEDVKTLRRSQWWVDNALHPTPAGNEYISYPFEAWLKTL